MEPTEQGRGSSKSIIHDPAGHSSKSLACTGEFEILLAQVGSACFDGAATIPTINI